MTASGVAIGFIKLYKIVGSPLFTGSCRFDPSCSTYAIGALEEHGLVKGIWLALRRLGRCHPLGSSGFDPVPRREH